MGLTVPTSYWNSYSTDSDRRIPLQEPRGCKLCYWSVSLSDKPQGTIICTIKATSWFLSVVISVSVSVYFIIIIYEYYCGVGGGI